MRQLGRFVDLAARASAARFEDGSRDLRIDRNGRRPPAPLLVRATMSNIDDDRPTERLGRGGQYRTRTAAAAREPARRASLPQGKASRAPSPCRKPLRRSPGRFSPSSPATLVQSSSLGRRVSRIEPISEEPIIAPLPRPEPTPRPQREALTALADDLSTVVPATAPASPPPPRSRPTQPARSQPTEPRGEHRVEPPRLPTGQPASDPAAADQSLAEMAQRLEAALRKPKTSERAGPTSAATADDADRVEEQTGGPLQPPRAARPTEAKPARAEAKPKEGKALYDTLEQEMASLLGRPANKT